MREFSPAYLYQEQRPSEVEAYQWCRVQGQLSHAVRNVPFYRRLFAVSGRELGSIRTFDDFRSVVPSFTKEDLIEAQRADPPLGGFLAENVAGFQRFYAQPGPIRVAMAKADYQGQIDTYAAVYQMCGVRPGDRADVIVSYHWTAGGTLADEGLRRVGCAVLAGGTGNSRQHVESLRDFEITVLVAFPAFLITLSDVAREIGVEIRDLPLRLAIVSGELKGKERLGKWTETTGVQVRESYGTADLGATAAECQVQDGMHLLPRYHYVEVLDLETDEPVSPGQPGEMVVTELYRKSMPFIRYRTGDITAWVKVESCQCGRVCPRLGPILGRVGEIPKVKGMFIVPRQVQEVLDRYDSLARFQMIVDTDGHREKLTLRIGATDPDAAASLTDQLQAEFKQALGVTPSLVFQPKHSIPEGAPVLDDRRSS
jgi:phenylacetate-CoA ligase